MVAKITTGAGVYGALAYNQEKVDQGMGEVLMTHNLREPEDGHFSAAQTAEDILRWMPQRIRTEKPVIHISLNPDPQDSLTNEQLGEIAAKYMERMKWGEQPYIVFKHTDIDRTHIHIVSVQVQRDGRKINDSKRNLRSVAITEELEREYALHPTKGQKRTEQWQLTPVITERGELKKQIAAVIKPAVTMYRFQTLGEYRALLSLYHIGIEEVRGERNGDPYRGLLYVALDAGGEKCGTTPLKSSVFGKSVGLDALQKHMADSADKVEKELEYARRRVGEALRTASTENQLRERLRTCHIDLYLRHNEQGRITGATFIDHETRCVVNGSRMGKEYSANALHERFRAIHTPGADSIQPKTQQRPTTQTARKPRRKQRSTHKL